MSKLPEIAIVGLSPLMALAINSYLDRIGAVGVCLESPEDTLVHSEPDWRYIVSPMTVVRHFDFFVNRKGKTLVIYDGGLCGESASEVGGIQYVSAESENDVITNAIEYLISPGHDESQGKSSLSHREIEVLREIASGKTNKEIADKLCISVNTVMSHRKNITAKLGIRSASALSLYALMNGLL